MALATINCALSTLRGFCAWTITASLVIENVAAMVDDIPTAPLAPRGLPAAAVNALLRAAHAEQDTMIRLRDETALALLIYGGLRVQEVGDV